LIFFTLCGILFMLIDKGGFLMEKFKTNHIYNEDCIETLRTIYKSKEKIDIVVTSPPYNTSRVGRKDKYSTRYDGYGDNMTDDEYISWTKKIFNALNYTLSDNGCILYNISYSGENTHLQHLVVSEIISNTDFTVADVIYWKKNSALPNNVSKNKLTRIVEPIYVFCRKSELLTFNSNKKVKSINEKTNQKFYENVFNFIEAKNNDGSNNLNKATFSSDLVYSLLDMYATDESIVYDPFMGTGTTAIGALRYNKENGYNLKFIGSEISSQQVEFSNNRIVEFENMIDKGRKTNVQLL
jgi:site-specific DNA-methyltransferase (adenine-specific)